MNDRLDDRLLDVLAEWEESRDRGDAVSIEQLKSYAPEISAAIESGIADLEGFNAQLRELGLPINDTDASLKETSVLASQHAANTVSRADAARAEASAPQSTVRRQVGRYRLERELGRGGFGTVYLAYDTDLARPVALKIPNVSDAVAAAGDDLQKEAQAFARLEHPHIVPVYDVGRTEDGLPFIVLKYMDGSSLKDLLKQGKLPPTRAAGIAAQVAEALSHAHLQGFVHRDLKPANILFDEAGCPYVTDFGLAFCEEERWNHAGERSGTLAYMAPEQISGDAHRLDGRADIWALGVILYEMLTGRQPFHGNSGAQLLDDILHREMRPPRQLEATVAEPLQQICLRCCEKDPRSRYASAADVVHDLRRWLKSVDSPNSLARRVAAAGVVAALVSGGVLFALLRSDETPDTAAADPAADSAAIAADAEISAELDVIVHARSDALRQFLSIRHPRALPLIDGDSFRIQAELSRAAYAYLIWVDTQGNAIPLYPWQPADWKAPQGENRVRRISWPTEAATFDDIAGPAGTETICFLTREEPLPAGVDLQKLLGDLPAQPEACEGVIEFVNGNLVIRDNGPSQRGPGTLRGQTPDNSIARLHAQLHERLQQHFSHMHVISFANRSGVPSE